MISLRGISYRYPSENSAAGETLKDINLTVRPGECILLTGASGCGKTTLTRVLNGLCPQFHGGELKGSYLLQGENAAALTLQQIGKQVGSVFQDPRSQFFCINTTDEAVFSMECHGLSHDIMHQRLDELCEILPIRGLLERDIFKLSSGEKQKIAIASVCAAKPPILVLDEPSANLDQSATEQLADLLTRLKRQGCTIIISEHRLHYLRDLFDRMVIMEDGRIIEQYGKKDALALGDNQLHERGLRLFEAPKITPAGEMTRNTNVALRTEKLFVQKGTSPIIADISLCASSGEILAITGSNGAGKTTLLRTVTGIEKESGGAVFFADAPLKRKQRIRHSFFVQQDADYQLYAPTVWEEIMLNLKPDIGTKARAEELLGQLHLLPFRDRHPASLSGGQKQRLLIAAACLRDRPVLVFDEPTSGLDGRHMREVALLMRKLAAEGKAVILITHDMELVREAATRITYLEKGKVQYDLSLS